MPIIPVSWLLWLALIPFAAAIVAPPLVRALGGRAGWLLALAPAFLFLSLLSMVPTVADGTALTAGVDWASTVSVRYAMRIDGLSLTFALLITGIGTLIVIYAGGYLAGHHHQGRFMAFLLAFMGSMLGLVLADDLISLFIFYELTSITSFLLIGFDHKREAARRAAVQALVITGGGGLALLAGLVTIRLATGDTSVTELFADPEVLRESPAYTAIFVLLILGAFTKSAQVPFHSWLPNAMEAPTPVSAYLHSATMVKAGVFVLMRFHPVMGGTDLWHTVLPLFGGATFLTGVLLGIRQTDLKQILAYTTVASLGLLVLLVGVGTELALAGAVLYLIAHALFKGGLFMVAGAIDHETGTRDVTRLGGLAGKMPITLVAALLGCLSMAGLPPLIGFVAKEVLYDGVWHAGGVSLVTITALVGNSLMFAIAVVLILPFFAKPGDMPKSPHEAPPSLWLGPLVLGLLGLGSALALDTTMHAIGDPMTAAVLGQAVESHFHLIPTGLKPPVILTLITIASGVVLALFAGRLRAAVAKALRAIGWGPDRGFDQALMGLVNGAVALTRVIQPGRMRIYVLLTFSLTALTLLLPLFFGGAPEARWVGIDIDLYQLAILAIAVTGVAVVIIARSRIFAIVALGVQGTMVALIFMLFGAPDLSFTQFMVETLSVVILALVMTRLNLKTDDHRPRSVAMGDGAVAVLCGLGFGLLLFAVVQTPFDDRLSEFFIKYAYDIAHGRNIVNVILVDYRALDTLGEIAVVMAAGLAILVLVRMRGGDAVLSGPTAADAKPTAPATGERAA